MINHPIGGLYCLPFARPQKNHYVVRKLLHPWLIEEQQIARLGHPAITADEFGIETLELRASANSEKVPLD